MDLYGPDGESGCRIHGTVEPDTIGANVSSGCVRLVNQDMIHVDGRAPVELRCLFFQRRVTA